MYSSLNSDSQIKGIVNMKVIKNKDLKIIVMDLLGPSLENLLKNHKQFRLKSIILLAIQFLDIMQSIHSMHYTLAPHPINTFDHHVLLFL